MFCLGKNDGIPLKIRGSTEVVDPETVVEDVGRVASPMSVRRERWSGLADRDDDARARVIDGAARDIAKKCYMYVCMQEV